jgi:hypothetical protein
MNDNIDLVILFVDMNDGEWRERYNAFIKDNDIPIPEINNVEVRSRDYGTLKCLLRSIDLYASWINNVFLVVQSESQVPKWVNRDNVKVITHDMIIPKEYLPVYNTFTIQTHLHRIPGLSEKFIQTDDDSMLLKKVNSNYFFIEDKCVHIIRKMDNSVVKGSSSKPSHYFKMTGSDIGKNVLGIKDDFYYQSSHSMIPMLKSVNEELYNKVDIKNHVSHFRNKGNIFRISFFTYAYFKRKIIINDVDNAYIDFKNKTIHNFRLWFVEKCNKKQMSIKV